jgi:hypothetical protein
MHMLGNGADEQGCERIESRLLQLHMSIGNISKNSLCTRQNPNPRHRLNFNIHTIDEY